ncbi:MAG: magnesium and cobalt transport protein CorA [Flavobacteriales bacterium]|nr:magnesium and cobalt transport protein CorA [Flavobacteriales bacterium]
MDSFLSETFLISYSAGEVEKTKYINIEDVLFFEKPNGIQWVNTYGLNHQEEFQQVIRQNNLDDFIIKLLQDDSHANKVIQLNNLLFVSLRVLKTENKDLDDEMMYFIVGKNFVWSIQEKQGDHFGWIRQRIDQNTGIIRKKKADYLLFLLIESIIDNYQDKYVASAETKIDKMNTSNVSPTPEFTSEVEELKQHLFQFKRATISLRDTIIKLEKVTIDGTKAPYFSELKEQVNNLISDIDFDLQELESKMNMIFSIQGHRLNEVMKTLTIFSVIFIPLTFIAGVYGMNFSNMPELKSKYGYFILLGVMVVITLLSLWIIKRKKWF